MLRWYVIDEEYVKYLNYFCPRVPKVNYAGKMKCFLGIIILHGNMKYFAPLTHWKSSYSNKSPGFSFHKLEEPATHKIYGAINTLFMFPVPSGKYHLVTLNNLDQFRQFDSETEKFKYWRLLKKELRTLNSSKFLQDVEKLHKEVTEYRNPYFLKVGIDFLIAEKACLLYKPNYNYDQIQVLKNTISADDEYEGLNGERGIEKEITM